MKKTTEQLVTEQDIICATHDELEPLSDLQLVLIGGGIADTVYG